MAAPARLQSNKPHRNFQTLPPEPTLSGTLRNLPRPSGTNLSKPSGTYLQNLRVHRNPPKSSGTFGNLPPEPTPFYTGPLRNLLEPASGTYSSIRPEPSGTCLRNLHQHTPELSGTFLRNLLLQPAPAHTGAYLG